METSFTAEEIQKIIDRLFDGEQILINKRKYNALRASAEHFVEQNQFEPHEVDPIFLGQFTDEGKVLLALY